jgi:hypothetical protein
VPDLPGDDRQVYALIEEVGNIRAAEVVGSESCDSRLEMPLLHDAVD